MPGKRRTPATMLVRAAVRPALRLVEERRHEFAGGRSAAPGAGTETGPSGATGLSAETGRAGEPPVLVALSGGADSLALAAAVAAEAPAAGVLAGAVVVDHGLQRGSADVAAGAASKARGLGLDPVIVRRVSVEDDPSGPEASARAARYGAIEAVAGELGAHAVLFAHTRDDQAEQVLLGLARGSGTRSLAGIPIARELAGGVLALRPLLTEGIGVTRALTEAACVELELEPWNDPHNDDRSYARVRVRHDLLPVLERELGPGIAAALARTADQAREDVEALDAWAERVFLEIVGSVTPRETAVNDPVSVPVAALADMPAAIRNRVIRRFAAERFGSLLTREHTLAVASLVTAWKGQGPIHVPGILVSRRGDCLEFVAR